MLTNFSNELAEIIQKAAPSVVQVRAAGRTASGIVYGEDHVLTTGRVVGQDEHPDIRTADGRVMPASIAGWDPASRLVLLKVAGLDARGPAPGPTPAVGHIAVAVGRSLSNGLTASAGIVSIIGGPLRTGRRRQLEQVIRISAPLHDGFAGGAVMAADGTLMGVATAAAIRGLPVVIPAAIAWHAARTMLELGITRRGYLGIAAQAVSVPERQQAAGAGAQALLVVAVKGGTPAAEAGVLVGDLLLSLDQVVLTSPDELIDLLVGDRVGRPLPLRVLRGGAPVDVVVTPAVRT